MRTLEDRPRAKMGGMSNLKASQAFKEGASLGKGDGPNEKNYG